MQGIVLASHGEMAKGLLQTSTLFFGEQKQIKACCLMEGEDPNVFLETIKQAIAQVDENDGVIVLCDMLFGTPCNCAGRIVAPQLDNENINVICGMNLGMLLQALSTREAMHVTSEELVKAGMDGVADLKEKLRNFAKGE